MGFIGNDYKGRDLYGAQRKERRLVSRKADLHLQSVKLNKKNVPNRMCKLISFSVRGGNTGVRNESLTVQVKV